MKNKKRKNLLLQQFLCMILFAFCIGFIPLQAVAQSEYEVRSLWTNFTLISCKLDIGSTGNAHVYGRAAANPANTNNVDIEVKLQIENSNRTWNTIASFTDSGVTMANVSENYALQSSGHYRIVLTAIANGSEVATCSSYDIY